MYLATLGVHLSKIHPNPRTSSRGSQTSPLQVTKMTTCQRREGEREPSNAKEPLQTVCDLIQNKCQAPRKSTSPHLSLSMFGSSVRSGVQAIAAIDLPIPRKQGRLVSHPGCGARALHTHSRPISPTVDFFFSTRAVNNRLCVGLMSRGFCLPREDRPLVRF